MTRYVLAVILVALCAIPAAAEEKRYSIPVGDSPQRGPKDAPVTIVEFLDFQ